MAYFSSESDQHNEQGTLLFVSICGILGGFSEFFTASITNHMTDFLIHFGQAVLFGAAGYLGKIGMEAIRNKFSKKEKQ